MRGGGELGARSICVYCVHVVYVCICVHVVYVCTCVHIVFV